MIEEQQQGGTSTQKTFGFMEDVRLAKLAGRAHIREIDRLLDDAQSTQTADLSEEQMEAIIGAYIEREIQTAETAATKKLQTIEMMTNHLLANSRWRRIAIAGVDGMNSLNELLNEIRQNHLVTISQQLRQEELIEDFNKIANLIHTANSTIPRLDVEFVPYVGKQ